MIRCKTTFGNYIIPECNELGEMLSNEVIYSGESHARGGYGYITIGAYQQASWTGRHYRIKFRGNGVKRKRKKVNCSSEICSREEMDALKVFLQDFEEFKGYTYNED